MSRRAFELLRVDDWIIEGNPSRDLKRRSLVLYKSQLLSFIYICTYLTFVSIIAAQQLQGQDITQSSHISLHSIPYSLILIIYSAYYLIQYHFSHHLISLRWLCFYFPHDLLRWCDFMLLIRRGDEEPREVMNWQTVREILWAVRWHLFENLHFDNVRQAEN